MGLEFWALCWAPESFGVSPSMVWLWNEKRICSRKNNFQHLSRATEGGVGKERGASSVGSRISSPGMGPPPCTCSQNSTSWFCSASGEVMRKGGGLRTNFLFISLFLAVLSPYCYLGFPLVAAIGGCSLGCCVLTSYCSGFSCCRAWV